MKKTLYYIGALLIAITTFTSCEEELMDFEGEDSLYFDARWYASHLDKATWPHRLHTQAAFGNIADDEIAIELPVRTTGEVKDYDRPYTVQLVQDSTTAVSGREFTGLFADGATVREGVIKAGQLADTLRFIAKRSSEIYHDTLRLQLRIIANEHFTTNFKQYRENGSYSEFVNIGGSQAIKAFDVNNDATVHNIYFYNTMLKPKGWYVAGGTFTEEKIRKMCEVCDIAISEFDTMENMPNTRFTAYCEKLGKYLIAQAKLGPDHAVLEKDGTMMYVSYCNNGDPVYKWSEGKYPKDMPFYKQ